MGEVLILGIGNLLWADEGFGVRAIEALHARYRLPAEVTLLDGGTQGLNLLEPVTDARALLVFDAIDFALAPGTVRVLHDREVPAWAGTKMSLHQSSFQELLAFAELQGRFPPRLCLIGVQPLQLSDFGGSLSEPVRAALPAAIDAAAAVLRDWGVALAPRSAPATDEEAPLNAQALALDAYESGRPSAQDACRIGDARFLPRRPAAEREER